MQSSIENGSSVTEFVRPLARQVACSVQQEENDKLSIDRSKEANFLTITNQEPLH